MKFQFQKTKISAFLASLKIPAKPLIEQPHPEAEMIEPKAPEIEVVDDDLCENEAGWLVEMLGTDIDREHALPAFGTDFKKEQAALVKTIGARMREARELCNLSQQVAAERLGYMRSAKLSKVEGAMDTCSVPLHLIDRASRLYGVSIDFLFGASDDWDESVHRPAGEWLASALEKSRLRDLELIACLHAEVRLVSTLIPEVVERARGVEAAIAFFREINPDFDDCRGGAKVLGSVERLISSATGALSGLRRLDRKMGLPAR